jgi:Flp pilus assembly protein TadD
LREMVASRKFKRTLIALLLVALFFALTRFMFRDEVRKVDQWQEATKIHYQMGGVRLFKAGQYQEAIFELNEAVAMAPSFSPAHNLMGKSYAMLGKLEEAASSFNKVIALTPQLAEGYKNLGYVHLLQGDRGNAEKMLSKALSIDPNDDKLKQEIARLRDHRDQS